MNQAVDLDELTLFRDMARRAFEKEISPYYEEWEHNHMVPRELWNTLGQAGLLCPDVDEAYGGAGTTPHVTLAMIEELSRMGFGGFAFLFAPDFCNIKSRAWATNSPKKTGAL